MTRLGELHERWLEDSEYCREFDRLGPECELARALIAARARVGLTQSQLAERMCTTQSAIARLESGRVRPSTATLERVAHATGTRLKITFEPTAAD